MERNAKCNLDQPIGVDYTQLKAQHRYIYNLRRAQKSRTYQNPF